MTLTPIAERLAVELSLPVFTTLVRRGWDSNTQPRLRGQRFNPLRQNYVLMLDHVNIILVSLGVEQVLSVTLNDRVFIIKCFFRSPESLM